MSNIEESILKIQNWYRNIVKLKLHIIKQVNNDIDNLYNMIFGTMDRIQNNFIVGIFSQNKYNTHMIQLDSLLDKFKNIPKPLNLKKFSLIGEDTLIRQISDIKLELIYICKNSGMKCIYDIVNLFINISIEKNIDNFKLLQFYNNNFMPISCDIYTLKGTPKFVPESPKKNDNENDNTADTNQLIAFVKKSIDSNLQQSAFKYDKEFIQGLENIITRNLHYKPNSLLENIQGARLYIPFNNNNIIIVMNGYFKEDPVNISRIGGSFEKKTQNIYNLLNKLKEIPCNFKYAYIEQITLKDFIVLSEDAIIKNCIDAFAELKKLKAKTISSLVKDFLTSEIERQREILTLFLLTDNDTDTQYLAYLMYDMISNETYLLRPQPLAEQVYNSLHWSVQKLFKIAIKRVNKYTQKLLDFNENEIPYEKRICLMKADDSIKSKAMDKFKEVQAKSGDSAAKAQQYLDAILKIPFGIYKRETMLSYLSEFKIKYITFFNDAISKLENSSKKNNKDLIKKMMGIFKNIDCKKIKATTIDDFNITFNNFIKNNINEDKTITSQKKNLNTLKVKELKDELDKIDLSNKGKKNELIDRIINHTVNNDKKDSGKKAIQSITENYSSITTEWNGYKEKKKNYMKDIHNTLDASVHGHEDAKSQVERIIGQWINGEMKGYCFGFEGPPGTGKTSFAKKGLTRCLADDNGEPRPFSFIALGGSSNGATLEGHSYTYVGSTWGRIVDILMDTKTMNPIIFIDELDKVSRTEHGKEIIGILTHLTDSTQNDEFSDRYFSGIKFDLSKVLIIFSYNDPELIDRILLDRIHRIRFNNLSLHDKINVAEDHLLPEIYKTVGLDEKCIKISKETIIFIVENYTFEAGARKLKEKLFEIVREINLNYLTTDNIKFPIKVDEAMVESIFSNKPKIHIKTIAKEPRIGLVNGLYATALGVGGLTIIETYKTPCDHFLSLILTGQQGDVMQESVKCAKTIAWNLIPSEYKVKLKEECEINGNFGLHIHCPEAATPKDGPSAGAAMTLCILSVLMGLSVNNEVAMTGEIDLNGAVHAIGGLDSKVDGAKRAGAKLVLCPKQNELDLKKIRNSEHPPENDNFKIVMIESIWEVLDYALINPKKIKFVNYVE